MRLPYLGQECTDKGRKPRSDRRSPTYQTNITTTKQWMGILEISAADSQLLADVESQHTLPAFTEGQWHH